MGMFAGFTLLGLGSKLLNGFVAILPYVAIAGLVVGAYFYGQGVGTSKCHAAELQQVITEQKKQIKELNHQYHDAEIVIANLQNTHAMDQKALEEAQAKLDRDINNKPECAQPQSVVDDLNGLRQ